MLGKCRTYARSLTMRLSRRKRLLRICCVFLMLNLAYVAYTPKFRDFSELPLLRSKDQARDFLMSPPSQDLNQSSGKEGMKNPIGPPVKQLFPDEHVPPRNEMLDHNSLGLPVKLFPDEHAPPRNDVLDHNRIGPPAKLFPDERAPPRNDVLDHNSLGLPAKLFPDEHAPPRNDVLDHNRIGPPAKLFPDERAPPRNDLLDHNRKDSVKTENKTTVQPPLRRRVNQSNPGKNDSEGNPWLMRPEDHADVEELPFWQRPARQVHSNNKVALRLKAIQKALLLKQEKRNQRLLEEKRKQRLFIKDPNQRNFFVKAPVSPGAQNLIVVNENVTIGNESHSWIGKFEWKQFADPHEYKYLINPEDACSDKDILNERKRVTVLILVASATPHVQKREAIRRTWIRGAKVHNISLRALFLLGVPKYRNLQTVINAEAKMYNDIVQEDFVDSYYNLSIKTIMGMKWAATFCKNSDYIMKADDDVVVNVRALVRDLSAASLKHRANYAAGARTHAEPIRNVYSKWYTPTYMFNDSFYPPYSQGHGYVLSSDLAIKIYLSSRVVELFPWEDVFIGMLLHKLKVRIHQKSSFYFTYCVYPTSGGRLIQTANTLLAVQKGYIIWEIKSLDDYELIWNAIEHNYWPEKQGEDRCTKQVIVKADFLP